MRFHTASSLSAPKSLEQLVKQFSGDDVVYDPTGSISRARALVSAGATVRTSLGTKLSGLFYAPRLRTLYVALNANSIGIAQKVKVGELAGIERQIVSAFGEAFATRLSDCPAVRVGFGVPGVELVPVDQRSVVGLVARTVRALGRYWKPIAVATLFGFGANAAAAKEPAVSTTNLKTSVMSELSSDANNTFFSGALTAPLGESWGLQGEAGFGNVDGNSYSGVAGHIFQRDPESYLVGLFAAYASEDRFDLDATRLGAEAEIYLSQVSIIAKAGYQFSDALGDRAFGEIELRWYLSENFVLGGGSSFDELGSIGHVGAEWQPGIAALPGLAFRIDSSFGEDDYESIMGGMTYYFGTNASLKDRHRKQDPESALFALFQSVQQEKEKLCAQYGC